ncbi:MAG: 7-carboxy-7-deazaguanine synthase QueE [Campylobacter sp.]|nr:7-carboxy-7-deazaguanine synthase QueE [Campylobacter sp.]
MLRLVEAFYSIQGEGKFIGHPALFFRFAGCNLRCQGFGVKLPSPKTGEILVGCDTIRAVQTSHFDYTEIHSLTDLIEILQSFKLNFKPIVVITGGEPLLHYKDEIFYSFIAYLLESGYSVHFETNGTILVDFDKFPLYKKCVFCISPKLANSGEKDRLNLQAIKAIAKNSKEFFYKFVYSGDEIHSEILEISSRISGEIYCMPMGANQGELIKNSRPCLEFCLKNGYNYSDRIHIRVYNDKDGV